MSNPKNPLSDLLAYEPRHILLAFDNTEAACNFVLPDKPLGPAGTLLEKVSCGNGMVIVNELDDDSYIITDLTWSFDFFSPLSPHTTISAGTMVVSDSRGNQFPSFLRRVSNKLKLPQSSLTFYLVTMFRGRDLDNSITKNYMTLPLIISLTDSASGFKDSAGNKFVLNFTFMYNTTSQLPNYSKLNQFTITSKDNNPSRTVPTTDSVKPEIMSRAKEDALKASSRKERIGRSVPMRTLKEVFAGFDADLNEMRFENKRQLQEFISVIRPSSVKKIKTPKAKRVESGKGLPISFKVNLDPYYENYPVDNRNLMTEQTETRQSTPGITSLTIPPGGSIYTAVETIMKLSSRVGDDVEAGYAFKIAVSCVTNCEGIVHNTINVFRYKLPKNKVGEPDTGPDKKGSVMLDIFGTPNTLELEHMNSSAGTDVISLSYAMSPSSDIAILEEDSDDLTDDAIVASSQREQLTFERAKTGGFSGLRASTNPANYGLERAGKALLTDTLKHRFSLSQNTLTVVNIVGNPDLYSDIARNPLQVSKLQKGRPTMYQFTEFYPMYIKLKVKIGNTMAYGTVGDDEDYWYHTYHYHLAGVTSRITGGRFTQTLRLLSTDDAI